MKETKKELQLYIHIPFCERKCQYCDFLSFAAGGEVRNTYHKMLLEEIKREKSKREETEGYIVTSVFFGGGTPSLLPAEQIAEILAVCRNKYDFADTAEISVEMNPGTISMDKLQIYKAAGINRLSIGLQSTRDDELRLLGRIHTWQAFLEGFQMARKCGFSNINIDLMSALPNQTVESWQETLQKVIALEPEHLSAYSLIIEEETPFYHKYGNDSSALPSEDNERQMYYETEKILVAAGYYRYEISNYAKKGYECQHNIGYWQRKEYRGFGLGAASLMEETRFQVTEQMAEYLKGRFERQEEEILDEKAQMEEMMFLGLRLCEGISVTDFEEKFHCAFEVVYGNVVRRLQMAGLVEQSAGRIRLTAKGIDISNYVFGEFLV